MQRDLPTQSELHQSEIARQWADAEFAEALRVIKGAYRSHARACQLAAVVEDFMGELDGLHGLSAVEDAAARLSMALDCCHAPGDVAAQAREYHAEQRFEMSREGGAA
jgi:hypothetical protein